MLAEISSVPADFLKNAVVLGLSSGAFALALKSAFWPARKEISPQPLEVREAREFVTTAECLNKDAAMRERMARLETIVDQIRAEAKTDRESIIAQLHQLELRLIADAERRDRNTQSRINDLLASVSKVIGHLDSPTPGA